MPRIDRKKLWASLEELGAIGAGSAGRTRLALSPEDLQARRLLTQWMEELEMTVHRDPWANIWGVRAGTDPQANPVVIGSHIDTVREAGMFDGCLGVLSGIAVVRALNEARITTARPIAVISFTDEEGGHFSAGGLAGSRLMAGLTKPEDILGRKNPEGQTWGEALKESGFAGSDSLLPHAYLEYHIEQGPTLYDEKIQIGVVQGIVGLEWLRATFTGEANHAGAFPMSRRHDAGLAAARATVELNRMALDLGRGTVVTPGHLAIHPNLPNIIPGEAVMTVDVRQFDPPLLEEATVRVREILRNAGEQYGVAVEIERLSHQKNAAFRPEMISLVERKARELGFTTKIMPSGAGHDAQVINTLCPAAMIFAPSVNGRSHCPEEYTSPEDASNGADVLLRCVLELAG